MSLNFTFSGASPDTGDAEKAATGVFELKVAADAVDEVVINKTKTRAVEARVTEYSCFFLVSSSSFYFY
jgi:hypothetical protein